MIKKRENLTAVEGAFGETLAIGDTVIFPYTKGGLEKGIIEKMVLNTEEIAGNTFESYKVSIRRLSDNYISVMNYPEYIAKV